MRLVDVVLTSALIGLCLGLFHTGVPAFGVRPAAEVQASAGECGEHACERFSLVRTPMMRRTAGERG